MESRESRSPLKGKPLRLPGQSVQDELDRLFLDALMPYFFAVIAFVILALMEWVAVLQHSPRQPWFYTALAAITLVAFGWQFARIRRRSAALRLGRDGERVVGQFLEDLREDGARVFHDVPGDQFNLDHVVLSPKGCYVIETKTRTKPKRGDARVTMTGEAVVVGGFRPDRDPVVQVQAGARWLSDFLHESTGQRFPVRGVIVFPGWFVERMTDEWKRTQPWVLEPKALPAFIENEPVRIDDRDVRLAAAQLSRYVRAQPAESV